jgi:hypothetical protein
MAAQCRTEHSGNCEAFGQRHARWWRDEGNQVDPVKNTHDPRFRWLTLVGTIEGYVSGILTLIVFVMPITPGNYLLQEVTGLTLIGFAFALGIGGVRFGEGRGKATAWVAVVLLTLLLVVLIVRGLVVHS